MRTYTTPLGELPTEDVPMEDLKVGDRFVGEAVERDGELTYPVYEVTADCPSHERGWLFVRDLTVDQEELRSDGTPDCEGFFNYSADTTMHRVVGR